MANKSLAIIAAIAVIGLLFLVYLAATFETPEGTRTVAIEAPVPIAPAAVERIVEPTALLPTINEPAPAVVQTIVEEPVAPAVIEEVVELPTLNLSDAFVLTRLGALETGATLLELLTSEELIRLQQPMAVREVDANLFEMQTVSYQRYTPLIDALTAVDPDQAVAIYRILRPLFQESFAEIGYPNRSFDEVLIRAIDNVVGAQTAEGPFQLVKPKVMYVYADAGIESMTPVEKQLLRMGPQNAEKLKSALAQYRERLVAR